MRRVTTTIQIGPDESADPAVGTGMFILDRNGHGVLRAERGRFLPTDQDIAVHRSLVERHRLREGSMVTGAVTRTPGQRAQLRQVDEVDGGDPEERSRLKEFKDLVTIDPDEHYELGRYNDTITMRMLDLFCPIGKGQRGLIVSPPRSGKTTILHELADGISKGYPKTKLIVLLVDERPEEATDWRRNCDGQVFASTNDEDAETQIAVAEAVWKRCQRLVELGEDVVMLLDSITRLARAYNRLIEGRGKTMTGGIDARAMERPRQLFGAARNVEHGGSLTILGTALVDTGSRMDELIFQEFKGTGNAELILDRKLAEKRIFPALDIPKSGTRKEEKLLKPQHLQRVYLLRRMIAKMNPEECVEHLVHSIGRTKSNEEFLAQIDLGS
jgi:transcription termination factor Rho